MFNQADIEKIPSRDGIIRLWNAVTLNAIERLMYGVRSPAEEAARSFLFDESNVFFQAVCENLSLTPERCRETIRARVERMRLHRMAQVKRSLTGEGDGMGCF